MVAVVRDGAPDDPPVDAFERLFLHFVEAEVLTNGVLAPSALDGLCTRGRRRIRRRDFADRLLHLLHDDASCRGAIAEIDLSVRSLPFLKALGADAGGTKHCNHEGDSSHGRASLLN